MTTTASELISRIEALEQQKQTESTGTTDHKENIENILKCDGDCRKDMLAHIDVCEDCEEPKFIDSECKGSDCGGDSNDDDE